MQSYSCKKCGLNKENKNVIFGRGNEKADVLVITDQSIDFLPISFLLKEYIPDYYLTFSVICPTKKKATPTQLECCKKYTFDVIEKIKPKVILTFGDISLRQITGLNLSSLASQGKKFFLGKYNCWIVNTFSVDYFNFTKENPVEQYMQHLRLVASLIGNQNAFEGKCTLETIKEDAGIIAFLDSLNNCDCFAYDLETTGLNPYKDNITDISFCKSNTRGIHISWENMKRFLPLLKVIMENSKIRKVGHNISFDNSFLTQNKINVVNCVDTMLMAHTLTAGLEGMLNRNNLSLKTLAWKMTPYGGYEDTLGKGGIEKYKQDDTLIISDNPYINSEELTSLEYYAAMDALVTFTIYEKMLPMIEKDFNNLFFRIVEPLRITLQKMTANGLRFDLDYMNKIKEENQTVIENIKIQFFKDVDCLLDINSLKDLGELFFDKLKLPVNKEFLTPKGVPSLNNEAITYYGEIEPKLNNLLLYRKKSKENSTYFEGMIKNIENDGRVHSQFSQHRTATGRLSSGLLTIPRDNRVRNIVVPDKGNVFIQSDFSQLELRVLAEVSGCKNLISAFQSGQDIHTISACRFFKIKNFNKYNKDHAEKRTQAKTVNFGIIYGIGAYSLSKQLNIEPDIAQVFINKFFETYPRVGEWMDEEIALCEKRGYVKTLYGRRRFIHGINSDDKGIKNAANRRTINTIIQGLAVDITHIVLNRIQYEIEKNNLKAKLVLVIHDEIILECEKSISKDMCVFIKKIMVENIPYLKYPLEVDAKITDVWTK